MADNSEIRQILYDLHKENKEDIKELRKDIHTLSQLFIEHKTRIKTIGMITGAIGGAIITITSIVVPVLAKFFF